MFVCLFVFQTVSLCSPNWSQTQSDPPASVSQDLGLQVCTITSGFWLNNLFFIKYLKGRITVVYFKCLCYYQTYYLYLCNKHIEKYFRCKLEFSWRNTKLFKILLRSTSKDKTLLEDILTLRKLEKNLWRLKTKALWKASDSLCWWNKQRSLPPSASLEAVPRSLSILSIWFPARRVPGGREPTRGAAGWVWTHFFGP